LFNVLDYSMSKATFVPDVSDDGGLLLQVSGLRITVNPELEGPRLIAIEVYDSSNDTFVLIERLRMYSFATDSYLCGGYDEYSELLGDRLVFEGEDRGLIGTDLHQDAVAEFLSEMKGPYNTSIQGRLVNNTNVTIALDLVQTADSCLPGTYYSAASYSCEACPVEANVRFLSKQLELQGEVGSAISPTGEIELVNTEQFAVAVSPKSLPPWIELSDTMSNALSVGQQIDLASGTSLFMRVRALPTGLEPGTALVTVSFSVASRGNFPGCSGLDAAFDVFMRVIPSERLNQLGMFRILGFTLSGIVVSTAMFFCAWVLWNRELRIVKTMQPIFLVAICIGVCIMGLTIVPLSIDDGIASDQGSDMACTAIPWLFSMGFTLSQSALFSKLWRINKLFNAPQIRRMQVHEKDVIGPFAVLFTLNFSALLIFTLVDPLRFERVPMAGEEWNTYGKCTTSGAAGRSLLWVIVFINLCAMAFACYQAYLARNVSDEFSEGSKLGIVMFSWAQIMIVGIPVLFLIDADNPVARYFISVILCFGGKQRRRLLLLFSVSRPLHTFYMSVCESLLLVLFIPMLMHVHRGKVSSQRGQPTFRSPASSSMDTATFGRTRISGIDLGNAMHHDSEFSNHSEAHAFDVLGIDHHRPHLPRVDEADEAFLEESARNAAASLVATLSNKDMNYRLSSNGHQPLNDCEDGENRNQN
jgi:7 transmembrane sweet-taste receptor of 3 GCPR